MTKGATEKPTSVEALEWSKDPNGCRGPLARQRAPWARTPACAGTARAPVHGLAPSCTLCRVNANGYPATGDDGGRSGRNRRIVVSSVAGEVLDE